MSYSMKMTNEEAIEILDTCCVPAAYPVDDKKGYRALQIKTAVQMAIKALNSQKTGIWEDTGALALYTYNPIVKCSVCGHEEQDYPKFCSNCGSRNYVVDIVKEK